MDRQLAVVVLISGSGTNLQAIIDACAHGHIPARITAVVSDKPEGFGLSRAERAGIETRILTGSGFADRETYDRALGGLLDQLQADLVVLAVPSHAVRATARELAAELAARPVVARSLAEDLPRSRGVLGRHEVGVCPRGPLAREAQHVRAQRRHVQRRRIVQRGLAIAFHYCIFGNTQIRRAANSGAIGRNI